MTADEVIQQIEALPPEGQAEVLRYTSSMMQRRLSPEELEALAQRFVDATDPRDIEDLRRALVRGFYGSAEHA